MGQVLSAHESHLVTSINYSHNSAPPTTRSDGFLWTTTSSFYCNARSSSGKSSSTFCGNTRCRCCNTLYRAKIAPVQAVIFWRRLPTLQQQQSSSPVHMNVNLAATFGQKMSLVWAYFTKLHRGSVRGTNLGKSVMLPASTRRQGVLSVHPQRYQCLDRTFAQGIIMLYYTPEAISQKCIA